MIRSGPHADAIPEFQPRGRVLLAEDDAPLRRAYVRALTVAGHDVTAVDDGAAAAELIATQPFDVVITDIAMPRMSGMQLLRAVRERDLDVPVLLMTGSPAIDTATQAVEHGALRYLVKPFELGELQRVVDRAVRLHRMARLKRRALELSAFDDRLVGDRVGLKVRLEHAMSTLWMAYQPIVSWSRRAVVAYEALLRTGEPSLPTPEAVIAAAERLDMVHEIGRAVRRLVAATAEAAPESTFFVNLHVHDLLDEDLHAPDAPLSQHAARVVLEITERAALDRVPNARAHAVQLRGLGFRIAMDDLGAGYAGLGSFAQLEPDVAKLDQSLTRNIDREPTRRALTRSMISVCQELGIELVAEGIETTAERDTLVADGCDLLQGYLFARPQRELVAPLL